MFVALALILAGLLGAYRVWAHEPRLRAQAEANVRTLAQLQARLLMSTLARHPGPVGPDEVLAATREVLRFRGSAGVPLVLGLQVLLDDDALHAPSPALAMEAGVTDCRGCLVTRVPLLSPRSQKRLGSACFYTRGGLTGGVQGDLRNEALLAGMLLVALFVLFDRTIGWLLRPLRHVEDWLRAPEPPLSETELPELHRNVSQEFRTLRLAVNNRLRAMAERASVLRNSQFRLGSLFEHNPVAIWEQDFSDTNVYLDRLTVAGLGDLAGYLQRHPEEIRECLARIKVIDANRAALDLMKARDKQALSHGFPQLFAPDSLPAVAQGLADLYEGRAASEIEYKTSTPHGSRLTATIRWTVLPDGKAGSTRVLMSLVDITAIRQAEDRVRDQAEIVDQMHGAVVATDLDGDVTMWNKSAERLFGYAATEILGRHISSLFPEQEQQESLRMEAVEPHIRGSHEMEALVRHKSGTTFFVHLALTLRRTPDGRVSGMIGCSMDITPRRHAELELCRLNSELEQRVGERTAELRAAQERLLRERRLATVGQLTTTVTKELRTPLSTIRASLNVISARVQNLGLDLERPLERILRNITRCDNMVAELDDCEASRHLDLAPTDVDAWLLEVIREQDPPPHVVVRRELGSPDLRLAIDRERLQRAIFNLMEGAWIAIGQNGGNGEVTVGTRLRGGRLEIYVCHDGPGTSPDDRLSPFPARANTDALSPGLGLKVVKQIVEEHGGGVEVASKHGHGAAVTLWLPLTRTA